jgi:protein-S-isoprenylcysteine O-methyltransferase Ste14
MHDWPALLLALILTVYWGRVLRLVYKVRRTTGRSANFAPPEPLGRVLRMIWYPAVIFWIVHLYATAFVAPPLAIMRNLFSPRYIAWPATTAALLVLLGTLVCWRKMGKSWRMGINPQEKTQLIVSGPYGYVRHPIYALSSLLMLSTMAAVPSLLMLMIGVIHLLLLQWEARREEAYLLLHHGQAYADYCRRVGRFFPRSPAAYRPGAQA